MAELELREALLKPEQDGVSGAAVSERTTNSKALESTSPNATKAPGPWSGEPRPRPPLSPRRFPPQPCRLQMQHIRGANLSKSRPNRRF